MRNVILSATAVVGIAAATMFAPGNARAETYPWCAVLNTGDASYNCGFVTSNAAPPFPASAASANSTGSPMSL